MTVDGKVPELADAPRWSRVVRRKPRPTLTGLRALADELEHDPRPAGVLVTLKNFDGGMASALGLRHALARFASRGRRVVVLLPSGVDTRGYFVASAAKEIFSFPQAHVSLLGFASRGVFVKQALAKAGVTAEVIAHGKYKSAGDGLTRDEMSEPQREQSGALLDAMYESLTTAMTDGRGLALSAAKGAIDTGIFTAKEAVAHQLLDGALHDDEVAARLSPVAKGELESVSAGAYLAARRATRVGRDRGGAHIGVVRVHGAISQGDSPLARGALERDVVASVRAARANRKVRGVILHIDSPGGSALASARMHRELELLAGEKPLVACMGDVAASGGYFVAAPAHAIVAEPLTITGSIGVISARFAFAPLMERLGVTVEVLRRGARADLFDPTRPLTAEERAAIEHEIDATYDDFVAVVARGRKKSPDEVDALAQGRVWSGRDAKTHGLVDALGGFDVALTEVRRRIGKGGDALPARLVRARSGPSRTLDATPGKTERALYAIAEEAMGPWMEVAALLTGTERVLLWAPETSILGGSYAGTVPMA